MNLHRVSLFFVSLETETVSHSPSLHFGHISPVGYNVSCKIYCDLNILSLVCEPLLSTWAFHAMDFSLQNGPFTEI